MRSDGRFWRRMKSPTSGRIGAIWGTGPRNVWIAEHSGGIFHFDGETWTETSSLPDRTPLNGLWGTEGGDLFAIGRGGQILHARQPK